MLAFLDFEASSLAKASYPIEVAWVFEDGRSETHLIRPAPAWTDWDAEAQAIHGIGRDRLLAEGTPHDALARHMLDVLSGRTLYATSPSWDGKWLSVLLRAAGLPRHALRLKEADEAHLEAARAAVVAAGWPEEEAASAAAAILAGVRERLSRQAPAHRALPDAEHELMVWREVARLAREAAQPHPAA
jgi:hypothetical protein